MNHAFADRCEFAQPARHMGKMALQEVEPGHASACARVQAAELKL